MTTLNFNQVSQTNFYPDLEWRGLNNVLVEDASLIGNTLTGNTAYSNSKKVGSTYYTERIILTSTDPIPIDETLKSFVLTFKGKTNVKPSPQGSVEVIVYISDNDGSFRNLQVKSFILNNKFEKNIFLVNVELPKNNYDNGLSIEFEFKSSVAFNVDVDYIKIQAETVEAGVAVILSEQNINIIQSPLSSKSVAKGYLTEQEINLNQGIFSFVTGNSVVLEMQEITLNLNELTTIAPDTWLAWASGGTFLRTQLNFNIQNEFVTSEVHGSAWLTWSGSSEPSLLFEITDSAQLTIRDWTDWAGSAATVIFINSDGSAVYESPLSGPWANFGDGGISAYQKIIEINTENFVSWEDSVVRAWMSSSVVSSQTSLLFNITDQAIHNPSHVSMNELDYRYDIDLVGWPSASNRWMIWDNQPQGYPIIHDINNNTVLDIIAVPSSKWIESEFTNILTLSLTINDTFQETRPYSHPNEIDYRYDVDLVGWPSASNRWMMWDNQPKLKPIEDIIIISSAKETSPYSSPNEIDYRYDVDLVGWPSASNRWMMWDNQPQHIPLIFFVDTNNSFYSITTIPSSPWTETTKFSAKSILIEYDDIASETRPYSHPNEIDYRYDVDLVGWPSASNRWMMWDNQPQYRPIDEILIISSAVETRPYSHPNEIDYRYDVDLVGWPTAVNPWMMWDNQPQYRPIDGIYIVSSAIETRPYSHPNEIDYRYDVDLVGWPTAVNPWMMWDNQPQSKSIIITLSGVTKIDETIEITADPAHQWITTSTMTFTLLPVTIDDVASQTVPYSHPNEIDYRYDIDLIGWPTANPWMIWDDQPKWRSILFNTADYADVLIITSAESPWILWNQTKDSPAFILTNNVVKDNTYDLTVLSAGKILVSYADTSSLRVIGINVSGYDIQLTNESALLSGDIESIYVTKSSVSSKGLISFLKKQTGNYLPVKIFVNYVSADNISLGSTIIDTSVSATNAQAVGDISNINRIMEYSVYDGNKILRVLSAEPVSETLTIIASSNISSGDEIFSFDVIGPDLAVPSFKNITNNTFLASYSPLKIESIYVSGVTPGAAGTVNSGAGFVIFGKLSADPGPLRFTRINVGASNSPAYVSDGKVDTSADFDFPVSMDVVTTSSLSYMVFASDNGTIYAKPVVLTDDTLYVLQTTSWKTITTSADPNSKIIAKKLDIDNKERIACIYKHQDGKLSIKILEA